VKRAVSIRFLFLSAALAAGLAAPAKAEEKTLLAADGTVYEVRAGLAADLGLSEGEISPDDFLIEWTERHQDGSIQLGIVPGTVSRTVKRNLDLAYDVNSDSLLLLWKEDFTPLSVLQLGILRNGAWKTSVLLPNAGLTKAFNPQMRLTHTTVNWIGDDGRPLSHERSVLSIIWWEESQYAQARYAPIFLDEDSLDTSNVIVYDLPVLAGGGGPTSYEDFPSSAYLFPSLHSDGPGGAILATFADLHAQKNVVIRIAFPADLGKPDANNVTWMRRHIPIVGVVGESPISSTAPVRLTSMGTTLGTGYRPTYYWRDGDRLLYTRYDGHEWASVKTIPLTDTMSYERAVSLVVDMAAN
jgi:hypothetical protein